MVTEEQIYNALLEAKKKCGTQKALASMANISQGRVADYLNRRYLIGNMTLSTFLRFFPEMEISFFHEKKIPHEDRKMDINGSIVNAPVTQTSGFNLAAIGNMFTRKQTTDGDVINIRALERKIRKTDRLNDSERLKFLDFLDDEL